ncbi:hypothetical protein [Phytohalomonas tamaricis]|uniref:hypothetical protein n=1 Tax=Phytohalomonas tamaricis TaxID=2081032 RepID=UPI000D0BA81A|nr:hypothetical protein [Phytohalomonas tamaricis]
MALVWVLPIFGLIFIVIACVRYVYRTHDVGGVLFFWSHRLMFNPLESAFQRFGIVLMFLGVAWRYLSLFVR